MLALAHRKLPSDTTAAAVRGMPREEAESRLQLAGFAVLQCPLKPESEPALAALAGETVAVGPAGGGETVSFGPGRGG